MAKKLLVLGSGGREHAFAWRLAQDSGVDKIYVLPGNPGMEDTPKVQCLGGSLKDFSFLKETIMNQQIDLVIVGPEDPLALGLVDELENEGVLVVGPTQKAAQLESSKAFCKDFMQEFSIPTAQYQNFSNFDEAIKSVDTDLRWKDGVVVKASSLAAGKGVFVCLNKDDAKEALFNIMKNDAFTVNSEEVVLEQILIGKELSAFAICDGDTFLEIGYACDHKRLLDNDQGPNTGGMGTYTPQGWPSESVKNKIRTEVFEKTVQGMKDRGTPFKGVLFAGLMVNDEEVNVIEFNVRFGDPEAQVIMPTLKGNLTEVLFACSRGRLSEVKFDELTLSDEIAVHIVKVSRGYPALDGAPMLTNQEIVKNPSLDSKENTQVFYAGVGRSKDNQKLINTGGRVLGVTAKDKNIELAKHKAYEAIELINFEGAFWRKDIASK